MPEPRPEVTFSVATRADVPAILGLLRDDVLGNERETADTETYLAGFDRMATEGANHLIVGETAGRIVATFQLTFITGLSHRATRRAQVESVRVAADLRGRGLGRQMMIEAERRARDAGCGMIQLTTQGGRDKAQAFYGSLGYEPSHVGYKKRL